MISKLNKIYEDLKASGFPIILFGDPTTGKQSLTFTMALISFITDQLRQTDASSESMIICLGLYLGRTLSRKVDNKTIESEEGK